MFLRAFLRLFITRITCRVSGVVIRMFGGSLTCFLLSFSGVSPCLTAVVIPSSFAMFCSLMFTSLFSALAGVM